MSQILVIDDTKNIRKMVELTLTQVGHSVEKAEDGVKGLEKFGDGSRWDLTIIDQRMPLIEGVEVVLEARRRDPQARLIMMTAFASSELASQALRSGAIDFLRKPFTTATLRGAVDAALAAPRIDNSLEEQVARFEVQDLKLPLPGQPEFTIPSISYRINGFSFWLVAASPELIKPPGMEFGRFFQIRTPDGSYERTFVGITSHIKQQVQREVREQIPDSGALWDQLCGQALLNYLWETSEIPSAALPVYEVPTDLKNKRATAWLSATQKRD